MRRASEDDSSAATPYEDDEEEGLDGMTSREALPKEVRDTQRFYLEGIAFVFFLTRVKH